MKKKASQEREARLKEEREPFLSQETRNSIIAILLFSFAGLILLGLVNEAGLAGGYIARIFSYLFGGVSFFVPFLLLASSLSFLFKIRYSHWRSTLLGSLLLMVSTLGGATLLLKESFDTGLLGYVLALPILTYLSKSAGVIIFGALFLIGAMAMFNLPLFSLLKQKEPSDETPLNVEPVEDAWESTPLEKTKPSNRSQPGQAQTEALKDKEPQERVDGYIPPPLDILEPDSSVPSSGDIEANKNIIQRTLEEFGVEVEMSQVSVGPTVTQYTLRPAHGVNIARITGLSRNLSLALAAHPLRIEAPIPGRSLVGIEVPNKQASTVRLRSLLQALLNKKLPSSLMLVLGRDVAGDPYFANLDGMPHLLVAGATGAGKSVALNSFILTLIYLNSPRNLRFILIDPKRVEFSMYEGIPHLLAPVVVDTKKAMSVIKWAISEMERRYELLESAGTRDIKSYNEKVPQENNALALPYIVIIIDEMADLMAKFKREVEAGIVRLAQMARAVGIHLIASTQRPSTDVVTGLIKANITARVALKVPSQIDSRTILDQAGAEKLLGHGDMLFMSGGAVGLKRLQGTFVAEKEAKKVVTYLQSLEWESEYEIVPQVEETQLFGAFEGADELYEDAKRIVSEAGKASASLLQRRLQVGYARAARLLDMMEEEGMIGPAQGAKPREVIKG